LFISPLEWLRSGLALFMLATLLFAYLMKKYDKIKLSKGTKLVIFLVIFIVTGALGLIIFNDELTHLQWKFNLYLTSDVEQMRMIRFIRINSIKDFYKLPITWMFSTFMPITFNFNIKGWDNIMWILNYTLLILAPAYIFNVLF